MYTHEAVHCCASASAALERPRCRGSGRAGSDRAPRCTLRHPQREKDRPWPSPPARRGMDGCRRHERPVDVGMDVEGPALLATEVAPAVILLDTNAVLWLDRNHPRARPLARWAGRLYVSPASLLEIQLLRESGRV